MHFNSSSQPYALALVHHTQCPAARSPPEFAIIGGELRGKFTGRYAQAVAHRKLTLAQLGWCGLWVGLSSDGGSFGFCRELYGSSRDDFQQLILVQCYLKCGPKSRSVWNVTNLSERFSSPLALFSSLPPSQSLFTGFIFTLCRTFLVHLSLNSHTGGRIIAISPVVGSRISSRDIHEKYGSVV